MALCDLPEIATESQKTGRQEFSKDSGDRRLLVRNFSLSEWFTMKLPVSVRRKMALSIGHNNFLLHSGRNSYYPFFCSEKVLAKK